MRALDDEDIVGDWQRPSFDLASQSVGALDNGTLIAFAEVFKGRYADATVHPDHRGRRIGRALAGWTQERARVDGGTLVGQPVPSGGDAERLLASLGYHERWKSWVLELPGGSVIEPQPLAPGYAIREMRAGDERAAYQIIEDAFNEPARPRPRPGPARGLLRSRPVTRGTTLRAINRLTHRRPRALPARRHGGHLNLATSGDRGLSPSESVGAVGAVDRVPRGRRLRRPWAR